MKILFELISVTIIFGSLVIVILKILKNNGFRIKFQLTEEMKEPTHSPNTKECAKIFIYAMLFRLFMLVVGFIINCVFVSGGNEIPWSQFFGQWIKWDSNSYISIPNGYSSFVENGDYVSLVFFPMYSWIIKVFNIVIPNINVAALMVSSLCYSVACVFMYKLCCIDYAKEAAQKSVILMSIFPFGFFYGTIMSESTFLLTSVMTLYFTRKHNWIAAGLAGMCSALSRSVGVFLIIPATVEFVEEYKVFANIKNAKSTLVLIFKKWIFLLFIPLGTGIYLYINYKVAGSPFEFLRLEEQYWHQVSQPFFKTVGGLWSIVTNNGYSISTRMGAFIPGTVILFIMYSILILGFRKTRSMYLAWFIVYLIVNTTMSWPLSICRYLSCAVPAYIIIGDLCKNKEKLYISMLMSSGILMGVYYTGYLMGKQIL